MKRVGLVALAVLLLLMAGCASPSSPNHATGDFRTLTVGMYGFAEMENDLSAVLEAMNARYPRYIIRIERHDFEPGGFTMDQLSERFVLDLMAGKAEDVVVFPTWLLNNPVQAIQQGYFENLTPYLDDSPDFHKEDFYQPLLDTGLIQGKRYVVPLSFSYSPLITTEAAAKRMGYSADKPFTLDQWRELAVKTREEQGQPLIYSLVPTASAFYYYTLLSGCPNPCDAAGKTADFDTPEFRTALEFMKELHQNQGTLEGQSGVAEKAFSQWGGAEWGPLDLYDGVLKHTSFENFVRYNPEQIPWLLNYPEMTKGAGDHALVNYVMAINGASKEKQAAGEFCLTALDAKVQEAILGDADEKGMWPFTRIPINRTALMAYAKRPLHQVSKALAGSSLLAWIM